MQRLTLPDRSERAFGERATVSYDKYGSGLPLLLVHGSFSNHKINWEFVKPFFEQQFTVYEIAAILPDVRIEELPSQAHEGMTTAPRMYAESVSRFLLA